MSPGMISTSHGQFLKFVNFLHNSDSLYMLLPSNSDIFKGNILNLDAFLMNLLVIELKYLFAYLQCISLNM